ncbi:MAG: hypothetical protein AAGA30_19585, partial [Planctomycetota bacterium]
HANSVRQSAMVRRDAAFERLEAIDGVRSLNSDGSRLIKYLEKLLFQYDAYGVEIPGDLVPLNSDYAFVLSQDGSYQTTNKVFLSNSHSLQIAVKTIGQGSTKSSDFEGLGKQSPTFVISDPGWHTIVQKKIDDPEGDLVVFQIDGENKIVMQAEVDNLQDTSTSGWLPEILLPKTKTDVFVSGILGYRWIISSDLFDNSSPAYGFEIKLELDSTFGQTD